MAKLVPIKLEKEYVRLDKMKDKIDAEHKVLKQRLLFYHERGYEFSLIRPSDTSGGVLSIPWKLVAMELMKKLFKKQSLIDMYLRSLVKKYPRTERAPALNIIGKKVKEYVEG
jgi:hypothetical protein